MIPDEKKKSRVIADDDGLFIPSRQLSIVCGAALVLGFFVFMGGYFVGKNTLIEPFMVRVEQTAFADQIYTNLCARYDQTTDDNNQEKSMPMSSAVALVQPEKNTETPMCTTRIVPVAVATDAAARQWYAPLIGYGKEQSALAFADKLHQKGIAVTVKKHPSKTTKGKVRYWYQVVTAAYDDRALLQALVDKVAQEEKIKNIKIIEIA